MSFLGRKLVANFQGEVASDLPSFASRRVGGSRIKLRVTQNWPKTYDKAGLVLPVETVIDNPEASRVRKKVLRDGQPRTEWVAGTIGRALGAGREHLAAADPGRRARPRAVDARQIHPRPVRQRLADLELGARPGAWARTLAQVDATCGSLAEQRVQPVVALAPIPGDVVVHRSACSRTNRCSSRQIPVSAATIARMIA